MSSPFDFLQAWYRAQCNGFWEHVNGVTIETLDNPGWMVTIDLAETELEGRAMEPVKREQTSQDWIVCVVDHNQFKGSGDIHKLGEILESFKKWAGKPTTLELV